MKRAVTNAGFTERKVKLVDGSVFNYGEGPEDGPALLLIHGQGRDWTDYAGVLPRLSRSFHVYAVDCYGHGKSSKNEQKYVAEEMGKDLIWFIKHVIAKPVYVSGHCSGGLLAAWLAANLHVYIKALVLENPPLFSTERHRIKHTYAWVDSYQIAHRFFQQNKEPDFLLYYLRNSYWRPSFDRLWILIFKEAMAFRKKNQGKVFRLWYLSFALNKIWEAAANDHYDKKFADAFYDGSWFKNYNQAAILRDITCPTMLLYAKSTKSAQYDERGILLSAMNDGDAKFSAELIPVCALVTIDAEQNIHQEKPKDFVQLLRSIHLQ